MNLAARLKVLVSVCIVVLPFAASAQTLEAPTATLRLGQQSSDVRLLQLILNSDPTTQVAQTGPGSPGNETTYFGQKTLVAVEQFQAKYGADILVPAGLSAPTGFVGPATLAKLRSLRVQTHTSTQPSTQTQANPATPSASAAPASSDTPSATAIAQALVSTDATASTSLPDYLQNLPPAQPLTPGMVIPATVNPNSINIDYAIAVIDARGKEEGYDPTKLAALEAAVRQHAVTDTTNYAQQFFSSVTSQAKNKPTSVFATVVTRLFAPILSFAGFDNIAHAQTVGIPFGTPAVLAIIPCTCSGHVVDVFMTPIPPTFAASLSYIPGTQLLPVYSITHPKQVVRGFYEPGEICLVYVGAGCAVVPNWGFITPEVESSEI